MSAGEALRLNINVPNNSYGLMMLYLVADEFEEDAANSLQNYLPYLGCLDEDITGTTAPFAIFNYSKNGSYSVSGWTWWHNKEWDDISDGNKRRYSLRLGVNPIVFTKSCTLFIYPPTDTKARKTSVLVMSDLDIININNDDGVNTIGINVDTLDYRYYGDSTSYSGYQIAERLLADIRNEDPDYEFYYNCPMNNDIALDLNEADDKKLSSPLVWYEYNNVNNKFVISEIDADYLDKGIVISRASKR